MEQEDYDQNFEINSIIKKNNSFSKYTYDVICSSTIHFYQTGQSNICSLTFVTVL